MKKQIIAGLVVVVAVVAWFVFSGKNNTDEKVDMSPSTSVSSEAKNTSVPTETETYTNSTNGLSLKYPKGWTVTDSGLGNGLLVLITESSLANQGTANINVVTESSQGLDLDGYVTASQEFVKSFFKDYKSLGDKKVTVSGIKARLLSGEFSVSDIKVSDYQLILVKDGQAYIVTATSTEADWAKYSKIFEESVLSLKITK